MDFVVLRGKYRSGRKVKTESAAKTILLHSRLTRHAKKRPTSINGIKAAKLQNPTFRATTTLLDSENPEKLAMIRLETKVHDIPKPIPIKMASKAINKSGPEGIA